MINVVVAAAIGQQMKDETNTCKDDDIPKQHIYLCIFYIFIKFIKQHYH